MRVLLKVLRDINYSSAPALNVKDSNSSYASGKHVSVTFIFNEYIEHNHDRIDKLF